MAHGRLSTEHRTTLAQLEQMTARASELLAAKQELEESHRSLDDRLRAALRLHESDVRHREEEQQRHKAEVEGLQQQLAGSLQQQQVLVQQLAKRDNQVRCAWWG